MKDDVLAILRSYLSLYSSEDDSGLWFQKITDLSVSLGFAGKPKEYKQNPDAYKGHVGDVSMVIRIAVTGKTASPDLYSVMKILGKTEVIKRMNSYISLLEENKR